MRGVGEDLQSWRLRRQKFARRRAIRASRKQRVRRARNRVRIAVAAIPNAIPTPPNLIYYARRQARREVEDFLEHVSSQLARGRKVCLDLKTLERLYPCGLLIFMGWIDEWTAKYPNQLTATYPEDDLVEQMLQHVGVLGKLGLTSRKKIEHDDVKRWHYFWGRNADATPIEPFMLELQKILGEEKQLGLGNCVTEAMTNVRHHAYEGEEGGPWWIFATISKGTVFVALHDRGESVPATLLSKPSLSDFLTARMWTAGRGDGRLITAAVGGRTRTALPYRGKGLPEMLEFTRSYPNSELGIFSRRGFYRFDGQESMGKLVKPIKGTLVIWMLRLGENK